MSKTSKKQDKFIGYNTNEEIWTTLNWNGILIPRYQISNFGRLYDHVYKVLVGCSLDKDGYLMASINIGREDFGNPYKKIRLHRFELMSFDFRPDFEYLYVNHKDGIKLNLLLNNLEWSLPIENTQHGWENNLNMNIGVNNGNGKHDDSLIINICELIDKGLSNAEICNVFNITDSKERMRLSATISGIRNRKTHKYISCNYSFAQGADKIYRHTLEDAHKVCQLLSDSNRNYSYTEIMDILDIPISERKDFKIYIDDLIRERTAKSVTIQYNLNKPIKD